MKEYAMGRQTNGVINGVTSHMPDRVLEYNYQ